MLFRILKQISNWAGIQGATLSSIEEPLLAAGLTKNNIATLINGNRDDGPATFDKYQSAAYQGISNIRGSELQQILNILDVTTPNIKQMSDLLDQKKIFPNSWCSMSTPTATGYAPIYLSNGDVDPKIEKEVATYLPTTTGCEELGKIIPQIGRAHV